MYVYLYAYVCMCMSMFVCVCVCAIFRWVHDDGCMYERGSACMCMRMRMHVCVCVCLYVYAGHVFTTHIPSGIYMHTHTHATETSRVLHIYLGAHIPSCIHMHTHTHTPQKPAGSCIYLRGMTSQQPLCSQRTLQSPRVLSHGGMEL